MGKDLPVGRAQGMVLAALAETEQFKKAGDIKTWQEAERFFEEIGISVYPRRVGRSVVPEITVKSGGYAWNPGGDADTWTYGKRDFSAIKQWITETK